MRNNKRNILSLLVIVAISTTTVCFPLGVREGKNSRIVVRAAYDANLEEQDLSQEVLYEDWALIPDDMEMVDVSNGGTVEGNDNPTNSEDLEKKDNFEDIDSLEIKHGNDENGVPNELLAEDAFEAINKHVYIAYQNVDIKEKPDSNAKTLSRVKKGTGVDQIAVGDTWVKIKTEDGITGFVCSNVLSETMIWTECDFTAWVKQNESVRLRKAPDTGAEEITVLPANKKLRVVAVSDKWYKVKTSSGEEGYAYKSCITETAPPTPTPTPTPTPVPAKKSQSGNSKSGSSSSKGGSNKPAPSVSGKNGSSIVSICKSMLGTKYVMGGESSSGVDCSGLVVYAYRQIGVSVPHFADSIKNCGSSVSRDNIQPGDVVCWSQAGGGYCCHVGIYVGGGQVIHAAGVGKGVKYGTVDMMPVCAIRRLIS